MDDIRLRKRSVTERSAMDISEGSHSFCTQVDGHRWDGHQLRLIASILRPSLTSQPLHSARFVSSFLIYLFLKTNVTLL